MVRTFSDKVDVWLPGAQGRLPIAVAGHCAENSRIIINFPGWNGTMNGYEEKYVKLGEHLAETNVGSFVRTAIPARVTADTDKGVIEYPHSVIATNVVREVVKYVIAHSEAICGTRRAQVCLMGTSAGGGAIAAVAHEFPQVKKLLLIAPAVKPSLVGNEALTGIELFTGDVAIMVGDKDDPFIIDSARKLRDHAVCHNTLRSQLVPGADHHFSGEKYGRLLSLAPKWAFACQEPDLPDASRGIVLYGDPPSLT